MTFQSNDSTVNGMLHEGSQRVALINAMGVSRYRMINRLIVSDSRGTEYIRSLSCYITLDRSTKSVKVHLHEIGKVQPQLAQMQLSMRLQ